MDSNEPKVKPGIDIALETSALQQIVSQIAEKTVTGTYSQRNPALGKMVNCPFCGVRRRAGGPTCCNTVLWKPVHNSVPSNIPRGPKNPNPNRRFLMIHQLVVERQHRPELLQEMRAEMTVPKHFRNVVTVPTVPLTSVPAFIEAYVIWKLARRARILRNIQKRSRRINRGR